MKKIHGRGGEWSDVHFVRLLHFQECRLFNKTLRKVERCLEVITHRLAGGYLAIPPNCRHIALTIGQGVVPRCWLRGHAMKIDAPFKEWVAELKTECQCTSKTWLRNGTKDLPLDS